VYEGGLLMISGPTNVNPHSARRHGTTELSYVSQSFPNILSETFADLQRIFRTSGLILPLAGSGTLAAEVAPGNVIQPVESVLAISGSHFGDRLVEVAAIIGANVDNFEVAYDSVAERGKANLARSADTTSCLLAS